MGHNFWKMVNTVIHNADFLIEVVDARMIEETRNKEIEQRVLAKGKQLIIAINKADLVDSAILEVEKKRLQKEGRVCIFLSARLHLGTTLLKKKIMRYADKQTYVGIIGYPNTGKSSIINALRGSKAAPTSSNSNYTRAVRNVKISPTVMLIDTPGVYPFGHIEEDQLALICAKSPNQLKEPDIAAQRILEIFMRLKPSKIKELYQVDTLEEDSFELIEQIALARNKLKRGGVADTDTMSRVIVEDWQKGKLSLEGLTPTEALNE